MIQCDGEIFRARALKHNHVEDRAATTIGITRPIDAGWLVSTPYESRGAS